MFRDNSKAKHTCAPIGSRAGAVLIGPSSPEIAVKVAKCCAILAGGSLLCVAIAAAAEEATPTPTFPGIVTS